MSGDAKRLQWVDTAKGLSIILVVMMHSAFGVGLETGEAGFLHYVIAFATPFRMPEFFLISGLFLSQVIAREWKPFADRRIVHYFYFYALWVTIHIAFKIGLGNGDPLGAVTALGWAVIEPHGVLWFIYMLAVVSFAAKVLWDLRVPHWVTLAAAAALQILPVATGSYIVDEFAEYFVFFYAGYALAPLLFKLVECAQDHLPLALLGLVTWAAVEFALVFSPGFVVGPDHVQMGLASLPGLRLVLALAGSTALCVLAALLGRLSFMDWLRWLGAHSIVVYLAFSIPMAITRVILLKLGIIGDTGVMSLIVLLAAIVAPLVLYWLIQVTGWGRFLFERPSWAHLPGTRGSRQVRERVAVAPAE